MKIQSLKNLHQRNTSFFLKYITFQNSLALFLLIPSSSERGRQEMWEERRDEFPDFMDIPETFHRKTTKYQAVKFQQVGFYYLSRSKKSQLYKLAL